MEETVRLPTPPPFALRVIAQFSVAQPLLEERKNMPLYNFTVQSVYEDRGWVEAENEEEAERKITNMAAGDYSWDSLDNEWLAYMKGTFVFEKAED